MTTYKVTAYTTQAHSILIDAKSAEDAVARASRVAPSNGAWKEDVKGGSWRIDDKPTIVTKLPPTSK